MGDDLTSQVRVFPNLEELSRAAADEVVRVVNHALAKRHRCDVVLAGGNTPRQLYELLAAAYRERVLWAQVHWYWSDERYVPYADQRSNFGMVKRALLDRLTIATTNVYPMPTHFDSPEQAAMDYENLLKRHFPQPWPAFDIMLLGVGTDGHTASLYPGSPALAEQTRWVVAAQGPVEPRQRLTITLPVINHAHQVLFFVAGHDKKEAIHTVLHEPERASQLYPAARVRPAGPLIWFLDEDAAGSSPA
jgi:6-phosphogluconolactonase